MLGAAQKCEEVAARKRDERSLAASCDGCGGTQPSISSGSAATWWRREPPWPIPSGTPDSTNRLNPKETPMPRSPVPLAAPSPPAWTGAGLRATPQGRNAPPSRTARPDRGHRRASRDVALELRKAGSWSREIGRQLGVDVHTAHADVMAELAGAPRADSRRRRGASAAGVAAPRWDDLGPLARSRQGSPASSVGAAMRV